MKLKTNRAWLSGGILIRCYTLDTCSKMFSLQEKCCQWASGTCLKFWTQLLCALLSFDFSLFQCLSHFPERNASNKKICIHCNTTFPSAVSLSNHLRAYARRKRVAMLEGTSKFTKPGHKSQEHKGTFLKWQCNLLNSVPYWTCTEHCIPNGALFPI